MEINTSGPHTPLAAPAETDGQNRVQNQQQTYVQQGAGENLNTSTDRVTLSQEAQALGNQRNNATETPRAVQEAPRVNVEQTTLNATENVAVNRENGRAEAPDTGVRRNVPEENGGLPPQPTPAETAPPENLAAPEETAAAPAAPPPAPEEPATAPPPENNLQNRTNASQSVSPTSENTPQKPATESPLAATGGLAPGRDNVNLTV